VAVTANPLGTLTDSAGNTWTRIAQPGPANNQQWAEMYYSHNPTTSASHTFSYSGGYAAMEAQAFSGSASGAVLDQSNSAVTTGGQPGSITPTHDNELVVASWSSDASSNPTISSPYTITDSDLWNGGVTYGSAMAYAVQTTAAATNPTWTGAGDHAMIIASFI
jgi:hypothetical protein